MRLYLYNRKLCRVFRHTPKNFSKNFPPPAARRCVSGRHGRRPGRGSVSHAGNDRLPLLSEPLPQRNSRRLRDHPVHDGRRRLLSCRSLSKAFTFLQNMQICSEHIYFENGDELAVICQKCEIFRAFGVKKDPARLLLQGHFFYCGLQSGFAPKHEVPISACCGWRPARRRGGRWEHGTGCRRRSSDRCCGRTRRWTGRRPARRRCPA